MGEGAVAEEGIAVAEGGIALEDEISEAIDSDTNLNNLL